MLAQRHAALLFIFFGVCNASWVNAQDARASSNEDVIAKNAYTSTNTTSVANTAEESSTEPTKAKQEIPPIPANLIKAGALAAKYDHLGFQMSELQVPSTGDTVFGETFGTREWAADHKFGYLFFLTNQFSWNMREAPMRGYNPTPGKWTPQIYNGQRPSTYGGATLWVGYEINDHISLQFGALDMNSTWPDLITQSTRVNDLGIHAHFLKDKLVFDIGWQGNDFFYYESYIGGNLAAGTLGDTALLPYEIGMNGNGFTTPAANMKYKLSKNVYERFGVQRSLDPNGFIANNSMDGAGLRFSWKGTRALYIDEIGYKRESEPGVKKMFLRATGWYNTTKYTDFRYFTLPALTANQLKKTDNNWAYSLAADVQLTQTNKYLPFQGNYVGATIQYAPPQQNVFSQYYEIRAYRMGTFKNRPTDMLVGVVNHLGFSQVALQAFQALPSTLNPQWGNWYYGSQTNVGVSYGWHIHSGFWFTPAVQYTRHPTYAPRLDSPIWLACQTTIFF